MDEDAGCLIGISSTIHNPFIEDQDHKVAKQRQQEDDLRKENQE